MQQLYKALLQSFSSIAKTFIQLLKAHEVLCCLSLYRSVDRCLFFKHSSAGSLRHPSPKSLRRVLMSCSNCRRSLTSCSIFKEFSILVSMFFSSHLFLQPLRWIFFIANGSGTMTHGQVECAALALDHPKKQRMQESSCTHDHTQE